MIILGVSIGFTYIFFPQIAKGMLNLFDDMKMCFLLLPLLYFYFILHELLHALGYIVNGANYKKITFGMEIEKSVLYCLCKENITRRNILFSLVYPLFFIGIVTYVIGIIFNYPLLVLLSIANIAGAAGDIMYFLFIVKLDRTIEYSELDDGTSFVVVSKDDLSKSKHVGIIYDGIIDKIPRNDFRRVKISKASAVLLIVCVIALLAGIFI